jgi:tetratricopeptide (TPR) repeat protein
MNRVALVANAWQYLTGRLDAEPHNPQLWVQRGMVAFQLGRIADAIADFDRAEQVKPALTPYLWQRGLAYYYAERFAEGARQFEVDLAVNGHDVEETVWRYLCQAQLQDAAAVRASLLPVRHDARSIGNANGLLASLPREHLPAAPAGRSASLAAPPAHPGRRGRPPERPAARRSAVLRDVGWCWDRRRRMGEGSAAGVPWGEGHRTGNVGRLEGERLPTGWHTLRRVSPPPLHARRS